MSPVPARLPRGFTVRVAPDVRRLAGGSLLVGGTPLTTLRLSAAAARMVGAAPPIEVRGAMSATIADRLLATNLAYPEVGCLPRHDATELTVVVPVRDRPEQLDRCLRALAPLTCVVVDDASLRPGRIAEVTARHGARLLSLSENLGPGGARNAGVAHIDTPLVAFVDSDVVIDADRLLDLTRHLSDPQVALVGPRVRGVAREQQARWFQRFDAARSSLDQGDQPAAVARGSRVAWLPSACLVARRAALGDGFDAALRAGEDVDLVWRMLRRGHRVRYAPEVIAEHDVRGSARTWLGRVFTYGGSGAALAERHGDTVAPAAFTRLQGLAAFSVLARSRLATPLVAAAAVATYRKVRPALPAGREGSWETTRITAHALTGAVGQARDLTLRHWWPLAVAGLLSRAGRRTAATAVVLELAACVPTKAGDPPYLARVAGRRLHDLAYGAGLWSGVLRARTRQSARCLAPRLPPRGRLRPGAPAGR